MRMYYVILVLSLSCVVSSGAEAQILGSTADSSGCLACHNGIEPIRDPNSKMMQKILTTS